MQIVLQLKIVVFFSIIKRDVFYHATLFDYNFIRVTSLRNAGLRPYKAVASLGGPQPSTLQVVTMFNIT